MGGVRGSQQRTDIMVSGAPTQISDYSGLSILITIVMKDYLIVSLYLVPHSIVGPYSDFGLGPSLVVAPGGKCPR
jgi:hypothetical protein